MPVSKIIYQSFAPSIHIISCTVQGATEAATLLPFCQGDALMLLLGPEGYTPDQGALEGLARTFRQPLRELSKRAADHFGAIKHGHVTGFRWSFPIPLIGPCMS